MLGHSLILYETSLSLARPCLLVGRRVLFARRRKCVPHHGGPPLRKTFSPFSLRPRNKKKKSERGGFSSCGRSADAVYLLWVIRAGYLSETIGRSTALLSPTRFTFFFFLNSRIVNFCSNGGQIETGFHLFTFLTGISRCCELVQQPSKIYAF